MADSFRNQFHFTENGTRSVVKGPDPYKYLAGFGNEHQSEVIPGAIPVGQNAPQKHPFGLWAEQVTGISFAASRAETGHAFLYRRRPAAVHVSSKEIPRNPGLVSSFLPGDKSLHQAPGQFSWKAFEIPPMGGEPVDFAQGLNTLGGSGSPSLGEGIAYHIYAFNSSMKNKAFVNLDGDFLITAQEGHLDITTEFGHLYLQPSEFCVVQRGLRFKVELVEGHSPNGARGYIIETWGTTWKLPELGPIGGYGLANSRDFLYPTADIDTTSTGQWTIISKQGEKTYAVTQNHSPFDVVGWHGNYIPYKYDLTKYIAHNTATVDHTDPSINMVITAPSRNPSTPLCDYLLFGPRWDVAENTFRMPYPHRNAASEFLARIYGPLNSGGRSEVFVPGGASYEAAFTPHGNADPVVTRMLNADLKPLRFGQNQLTMMLESCRSLLFTDWAVKDSGALAAHDVSTEMWEYVPDSFAKNEEAIKLLKAIGKDISGL